MKGTSPYCAGEGCTKRLSVRNRSGYCLPCYNRNVTWSPERRAAQAAGLRAKWQQAEYREKMLPVVSANVTDPAARARSRETVIARQSWRKSLAIIHASPAILAKRSARASATRIGPDVPAHLIGMYRWLRRTKRLSIAEAKQVIRDHHDTDMTRFRREIGATA